MEAFTGLVALAVVIFLIALAILSILLPFFVFRIRNEMILMNQQMAQLVHTLGGKGIKKQPAISSSKKYQCRVCSKSFSTIDNARTHIRTYHKLEGTDMEKNIKEL